ncbi:MAG: NAD(P)/FAD-dependent oxidoreductase [Ignavibacteriaceae bacterium]
MNKHKVVIIGGGFGGLHVALELRDSRYEVTLIDKTNYHLFQPLLYQVATAALSPADIAVPIRSIFSRNKNIKVLMDEAISIDRTNKKVILQDGELEFDSLIISTGSSHSYFGNDTWEKYAPGLKTLSDGLLIREKILKSLEQAEKESDVNKRKKYLTFVIVGGGPTGVEMAGAIAEIAKTSLMRDFRNINAQETKIILIEALHRILSTYQEELSFKAQKALEKMEVELKLNTKVIDITSEGVKTVREFLETTNVIWAAGNTVSPIVKSLNIETDRAGRAMVNADLSINGDPNIFVIGDAALVIDDDGRPVPGVAQGAIQAGKYVGKLIRNKIPKSERNKFVYVDKGNMASIGRAKAVAEIKKMKLSGFIAWVFWCFIHIFFLIGFRNRFRVMLEWMWYYITFKRGIRLIVGKSRER